ncbi:MAG: hypothetical protein HN919_06665 [Verrucomicrobia bacterium]|nr:hypothetical protein [Verrucomicrobiota bacterium]MBT7065965.1 hypothetical protein [Verrucomicrobiota bacterium]
MKKKPIHKPCRKCHDCGLNLGDHCGVYAEPKRMWHHRACPGYKNEEMLATFEAEQKKHLPDHLRERRREIAKQRNSEPHWQGLLPHANR